MHLRGYTQCCDWSRVKMLSSDWRWGLSILAPAFQHYKMLSGARVCPSSLYLLCHWSPDHCNLTRVGSDMRSNLSSQHQPIRGLYPALWTNERLACVTFDQWESPVALSVLQWLVIADRSWTTMNGASVEISLWYLTDSNLVKTDLQKYKKFGNVNIPVLSWLVS